MARQSLIEFLDEYGRRDKEIAVAHRRGYRMERWSYGRIAETARGFASELAARGIVRGERAVLWGDNCAEWVAAFFGCVLRGVVVAPIDRVATVEFAQRVAQTVEAKLLIASRDVPEIYLPNGAAVPKIALEDVKEIAAR
ncbi:MAG TPA: AMP-binding protein, partial [Candidatus Acidoferrales bacterium]|nr:AMP-binding protein [Candidatus Acidoferrales bacterium]